MAENLRFVSRHVLLTGFEPFGPHAVNPSELLARSLEGRLIGGRTVAVRIFPVETRTLRVRIATALAEVRYHRERFLTASHEPPQTLELMLYEAAITGDFHDIRASANRGWYGAVSYARSQPLGARLHRAGSSGIVYRSVRDPAGECVAVFRPPLVKRCRPVKPFFAHWDGTRITRITTLVPTA